NPITETFAVLAFIFAAFTDWYDGYVARHENMVTNMGKFLDPLADKILICSVLIMFATLGWAPAWVVIIIVWRELIVTGLRGIAIDEGITLAADNFGKAKTVTQILAIIPICLHYPILGFKLWFIGEVVLYVAMILAVFSAVNYCLYFFRQIKDRE
ncbi:MAG: CDP-diacylglycerol--glycerol-3-phosphate 3-phosphatidyltransferase, partial [Desulfovibrio sp.]|nr:CDP-diacylglycerol--glycerol-3-phosphate 3-phosphatidyltransferase [Desulfovibrio sp.]